ncbi:MAG: anti-sigma factor RsiW [Myxococcota bacterium]|jgi:anti-sigma factor RsiW
MSLPIDETLIERYLDGELPPDLVARVETALETSTECQQHLDELIEIRSVLRADIAMAVEAAPLDDLWGRISQALDEAPVPQAATPAAPLNLINRLRHWWDNQRLEVAMSSFAAVCAVMLCVWFVQSMPASAPAGEPGSDSANDSANVVSPATDNTLIVESAEADEGTIVIDVDPEDPSSPAVVWHLVDEEGGA